MRKPTSEKRRSRRKDVSYRVWLKCGEDVALLPCTLNDVSDTGAQLAVPENAEIPETFTLQLSETGPAHRSCKVAWRRNKKIGVSFILREPATP